MSLFPEPQHAPFSETSTGATEENRRRFERFPASGRSIIYALGQPEPISATVRNISAGGALFEMAELEVGTAVQVIFDGEVSGFEVDGVVVRAESPDPDGELCDVAVRFERVRPV